MARKLSVEAMGILNQTLYPPYFPNVQVISKEAISNFSFLLYSLICPVSFLFGSTNTPFVFF